MIPRLAILLIVAVANTGGLTGPLRVEVFRDGEPVAVVEYRAFDERTSIITNARRQFGIGTAAGDPEDPALPVRLERSTVDATVHLLYAADATEPGILVTGRVIRQLAAWTGSDFELTLDSAPTDDALPAGNRVLFMRRGSFVLVSAPAAGLFLVVSSGAGF